MTDIAATTPIARISDLFTLLGSRLIPTLLFTTMATVSVLGAAHALLFWVSVSFFTPLVLLVGLFNGRRRLLHDMILGTVVINSSVLGSVAQPARSW